MPSSSSSSSSSIVVCTHPLLPRLYFDQTSPRDGAICGTRHVFFKHLPLSPLCQRGRTGAQCRDPLAARPRPALVLAPLPAPLPARDPRATCGGVARVKMLTVCTSAPRRPYPSAPRPRRAAARPSTTSLQRPYAPPVRPRLCGPAAWIAHPVSADLRSPAGEVCCQWRRPCRFWVLVLRFLGF